MSTTVQITPSPVRREAAAFMMLAATGIVMQIAGGADYPAVPPGLLILLAAAATMLLARPRWSLVLAATATVFITIGGVATPNLRDQLGEPDELVTFLGSAIQAVGLLGGVVCAALSVLGAFRAGREEVRR